MLNDDLKPMGEEELAQVNGGTGSMNTAKGTNGQNTAPVTNDDPLDLPHRLTWCGYCKKMVKYSEFTGGRYICDNCGNFVEA